MNRTDWKTIKNEIYYWDASWRDIYVLNTTQEDWSKLIDLINQNYPVEFYNGITGQTENSINKQVVFDYWGGRTDLANTAAIKVGGTTVKCHFFHDAEIENDIDP